MKNDVERPTQKMKAGIRKRGDSYTVTVSLGKDPKTGRYEYYHETFRGTREDAKRRRAELVHELTAGTFIKPGKATLAEYLEKWLRDYAKPNLSPRGYDRYSDIIQRHLVPEMGSILLSRLKPEHIQAHYSAMQARGLSAGTVRYHHAVLHRALATAVKWGVVSRNVADGVDAPRVRRRDMETWAEFEVTRFLKEARQSPYFALFHLALFTGMRRSELLALRWQDLSVDKVHVSRSLHQLKDGSYVFAPPKSAKSRRTIDLAPSSIVVLGEHKERQAGIRLMLGATLKQDDLVFATHEGEPLRPNTITRAWVNVATKAGVKPIRLHDARHTHASLLLKQGVHPKIVQERLGHASIQMTLDTYSHVAPGLQQAAAESFDRLLNPTRETEAVPDHY